MMFPYPMILTTPAGSHPTGYIFTSGFKSRLLFRSSVNLDALCIHECEILGAGAVFWPLPTFSVTAMDRRDEPIIAKSCTGCWSGVRAWREGEFSQWTLQEFVLLPACYVLPV